jgi:hypothetical protein
MRTVLLSIVLSIFAGLITAHDSVWARVKASPAGAGFQAVVDGNFNANIAKPAYGKRHPKVLFDEAHYNSYTSLGTYKPFVDLITSDGYKVMPNKDPFSKKSLGDYEVLVIANASGPPRQRESSPFTKEECDAVRDWVKAGGALLLATDHAPFNQAMSELARRFEVEITSGFTIDTVHYNKEAQDQTELLFSRDNGLLGEHAITSGRDGTEQINRIISFSGTSLKGPAGSASLLKLSNTAMDVLPSDRKPASADEPPADHRTVSAAGRAQAVALQLGKGRIVVVGEAAMLTAQVTPSGLHFGMNVSGIDNRQLTLNIMHWLSGLLK